MIAPPLSLPPKKEVALLLLQSSTLFVHLDPRRAGVTVPKRFARQPQLVLELGLNLALPIPDLEIDERGISCTLSFDRTPFWCDLPWPSVYAMVGDDGRGMVWPDDVPPELAVSGAQPRPGASAADRPPRRRRRASPGPGAAGALAVASEARDVAGEDPRAEPRDQSPPASPRLRLVPAARAPWPAAAVTPGRGGRTVKQRSKPERRLPAYLKVIK